MTLKQVLVLSYVWLALMLIAYLITNADATIIIGALPGSLIYLVGLVYVAKQMQEELQPMIDALVLDFLTRNR